MSQALPAMKNLALVNDKRISTNVNVAFIPSAVDNVIFQSYAANALNANQLTWQCNPVANTVYTDRNFKERLALTLQMSATNATGGNAYFFATGYDSLSCNPLWKIITNQTVIVNGASLTMPVSQYAPLLQRLRSTPDNIEFFKQTQNPIYPDLCQDYTNVVGTIMNPLSSDIDTLFGYSKRGGFNILQIRTAATAAGCVAGSGVGNNAIANGTMFAEVDVELSCYCPIAPFLSGSTGAGMFGVKTMQVTQQMGNFPNIWSRIDRTNITNFTVYNIKVTAAALDFTYLQPRLDHLVPEAQYFPYNVLTNYPNPPTAIGATSAKQLSSNNINMDTVAETLYAYAAQDQALTTLGSTFADAFGILSNPTWQMGSNPIQLGGLTQTQMWEMAVRHSGISIGYNDYIGANKLPFDITGKKIFGCGSILAFKLGTDVGLAAPLHAGMAQAVTAKLTVTCYNPTAASINYVLNVITSENGLLVLTRGGGFATTQLGCITVQDVMHAKSTDCISVDMVYGYDGGYEALYGNGRLLDKIKNLWNNKVKPFLQDNRQYLQPLVQNLAQQVAPQYAHHVPAAFEKLGPAPAKGGRYVSHGEIAKRVQHYR